jgi:transketolase
VVDGHDLDQLVTALGGDSPPSPERAERVEGPQVVVARTVFGKGVSFMESRIKWHYMPMNDDEYRQALAEVDG